MTKAEKEDNMTGQPTVYELSGQEDEKMDMEEAWAILRDGFNDMYTRKPTDMSRARYMELYTLVTRYNICVPPEDVIPPILSINLLGNLYQRLQDFLKTHLERLVVNGTGLTGEATVGFYVEAREDYNFSSKVLDAMCCYLNRHWVKRQRAVGDHGVLEVYQMALVTWRECFLTPLREQLIGGLLKLIEKDRNGETINSGQVSRATSSLVELAINYEDPSPKAPDLSLYKEAFENIFLIETDIFYGRESADYLAQHRVTRYMKRVEHRLNQEVRRTLTYLHESTLKPLINVCEQALIENHLEVFHEEFPKLLRRDQDFEIGRMFRLVSRTAHGLEQLRTMFEEHVRQQGLAAVERAGEDAARDPRLYANTLLQVYRKYKALMTNAFAKDKGFSGALQAACEKFVNSNYVTRPPRSPRKSPELLAKYCDILLLKSTQLNPDVSDLEEALNEALILFTFTEDKDLFQRLYSRMMATRLVQKTSVSEEAETKMILKFREVCGPEYTSKLLRMIQDIRMSKILNESFYQSLADAGESLELDFSVLVLTTGSWPFQASLAFPLPGSVERSLQQFALFYNNTKPNRKLTWLYHLSEGEIVTACFERPYILQASAIQMAVLLQFNDALWLTVQQLQEATSLDMETLQQVLQAMLEVRLLSREHMEQPNLQERLPHDAVVSVSEEFSNKRLLVDIRAGLKTEAKAEQDASDKTIKADRKICVQAAIVRIMKYRQTLKREEIVAEVIKLLSSRFKPEVLAIKECIEILVKKDYLEVAQDDADTYNYVA